jgi:hypothetical protein
MPNVTVDGRQLIVRHSPSVAGQLEINTGPNDGRMVLMRLNRNQAMVLSDLLEQVALELPIPDDTPPPTPPTDETVEDPVSN